MAITSFTTAFLFFLATPTTPTLVLQPTPWLAAFLAA
jgi:hypothetical protein